MRVDLNRIAIAGLVLLVLTGVLLIFEWSTGENYTLRRVLGIGGAPGNAPVAWILGIAGGIVYLCGRVIYIGRHPPGMPPRDRDGR